MSTTTERKVTVASGLGDADASQVMAGSTFSSESGFKQEGKFIPSAGNITYNNATSGLGSTNTQGAIDEIVTLTNESGHSIDVTLNKSTYVMTISLKDKNGEVLNEKTVDFPMGAVFVNASYDKASKTIKFTLDSGSTVDVPLGDLVEGLVSQTDFNTLSGEVQTLKTEVNNNTNAISEINSNFDGRISNLEIVYNTRDIEIKTAKTYNWISYKTKKGEVYTVLNNTDNYISVITTDKDKNTIQSVTGGLAPGLRCTFTCESDGYYLRIFSNGTGTVSITEDCLLYDVNKRLSLLSEKIVEGDNKFNKYEIVTGKYLHYSTGKETTNSSFCYSSYYSEVEGGQEYYNNTIGAHICFYDENYNYISGAASTLCFTTPEECKYLRASVGLSFVDEYYIVKGNKPSDYKSFEYKFKYQNDDANRDLPYAVVDANGSGDYTSVSEASANEPDGAIIYVMPGIYENEDIRGTWSKKQFIIGTSAKDCVIKNNTGEYAHQPVQIGSGYLKNLTFYAEKVSGSSDEIEYAVHVESHNLYNDNLTIENCVLISDFSSALGMGMRGGCNVTLKNCEFICNGSSAALLFHDSNYDDYLGEQNISIIDCLLYSPNSQYCLTIQSQEKDGSTMNLEMIRNRLKSTGTPTYSTRNYNGGTGGDNDFLGVINLRLKETSWGNSDDTFNA